MRRSDSNDLQKTGEPDLTRPFMNLAIIGVLKHRFFAGQKALHRLFPAEFKQNLSTADGGRGPEIPPVLLALATTFVRSVERHLQCDELNSTLGTCSSLVTIGPWLEMGV